MGFWVVAVATLSEFQRVCETIISLSRMGVRNLRQTLIRNKNDLWVEFRILCFKLEGDSGHNLSPNPL